MFILVFHFFTHCVVVKATCFFSDTKEQVTSNVDRLRSQAQRALPLDRSNFLCVLWTQFQDLKTVLTWQGHKQMFSNVEIAQSITNNLQRNTTTLVNARANIGQLQPTCKHFKPLSIFQLQFPVSQSIILFQDEICKVCPIHSPKTRVCHFQDEPSKVKTPEFLWICL